jgi:hypothetical protein
VLDYARFFSPGVVEGAVNSALKLAMIFHCSPFDVLAQPVRVVDEVLRATNALLAEMADD